MNKIKFLKVKLKTLAEEARIIRLEERRANKKQLYYFQSELREHRVLAVRNESFLTLLAYQYLRGKSFAKSFPECRRDIDWDRVRSMIKKYGSYVIADEFDPDSWINGESLTRAA